MFFMNATEYIVPILDVVPTDDRKGIRSLRFLGTGFFVGKASLLTCKHVADKAQATPCAAYKVVGELKDRSYDGLKNISLHPYADLAIARVGGVAAQCYKPLEVDFYSERFLGREVITYGYVEDAQEGVQAAVTPRLFKGHIMRASTERQDARIAYLEVSFPALAGTSGSPILDASTGRVLGIIYQNYRSQILEDYIEVPAKPADPPETSHAKSIYKVVEYAKALDLAVYRDFVVAATGSSA